MVNQDMLVAVAQFVYITSQVFYTGSGSLCLVQVVVALCACET